MAPWLIALIVVVAQVERLAGGTTTHADGHAHEMPNQ